MDAGFHTGWENTLAEFVAIILTTVLTSLFSVSEVVLIVIAYFYS